MSKFRSAWNFLAVVVFTLGFASLAQAQATRTWVSGVGDDVNPCSRTAPCKTFAGAISKTAAGGEINALDPGGYGAVTITKSITIDGAGTHASILHSGTNGVIVNDSATATPGTIKVTLRNLSINGAGTTLGFNGIRFLSGASLNVENVRIQNVSSHGIDINFVNAARVNIHDVDISGCTGNAINIAAGATFVTINRAFLSGNGNGLVASAGAVTITNSVIGRNTTAGVNASSSAAAVNATNNTIAHNGGDGVVAAAGSVVRLSNNDILRNNRGFNNAGTMETFGNNRIQGNTLGNIGALTTVAQQ